MPSSHIHLAHIINPVFAKPGSELHIAQPLVFQSMINAQQLATNVATVELFTTQYPEDRQLIPQGFTILPDLERSVLDMHSFTQQKKLPLLADILQAAHDSSNAEYIVFTNADIILMPQFYAAVAELIGQGHDALIINRRRIERKYDKVEQLPLVLSEIGMSHPGYDCFVMRRSLIPELILEGICVGVPFIGVSLAHNLFAFADHLKVVDDMHLTVHQGVEVMPKRDAEYYAYNRTQFDKVIARLKPHLKDEKLPYYSESWAMKHLKRGLNPSIMTTLSVELELQGRWDKLKYRLNDIRFQLLQKR